MFEKLMKAAGHIYRGVRKVTNKIISGVGSAVQAVGKFVQGVGSAIKNAFSDDDVTIKKAVKNVKEEIKKRWSVLAKDLSSIFVDLKEEIDEIWAVTIEKIITDISSGFDVDEPADPISVD